MKITVCGGSGFIGRRLVSILEQQGHQVHLLGRRPKAGMPSGAAFSLWDPEAGPPPAESLAEADAVIQLAGEPVAQRWSPEVKRRIRSSRVEGVRNLVRGMEALGSRPTVLISASAVGYYGDRGDQVLTEVAVEGTGFLSEVCVEWERAAAAASGLGCRVVSPRIGVVLGRGGGALDKMLPAFQAGLGGRVGSGRQWMPWIHLEDLCSMMVWLLESGEVHGPVNAVGPNPVTNSEFTRALGRALGRPAILPVPRLALRLLYGEMSDLLFHSQRVVPTAAQSGGFAFKHPEVFGALKDLLT
jgi:uncharacterized protein (TIGR01777 family)